MDKVEMMREALKERADAPPGELAAFLASRFGVRIEPKFIPILRASARDRELLEQFRARARPPDPPTT